MANQLDAKGLRLVQDPSLAAGDLRTDDLPLDQIYVTDHL
jgi:hypothetical protein